MPLSSKSILAYGLNTFLQPADDNMIQPASVDIRIGNKIIVEVPDYRKFVTLYIDNTSKENPYFVKPGGFLLASTYERITIPPGFAMDLRLKSSRAREGFDHALAFWFDPGWEGVGTMEIKSNLQYHELKLWYMMPFAQVIFWPLDSVSSHTYSGRYQGATAVESSKDF